MNLLLMQRATQKVFSKMDLDFATVNLPLDPCNKKKLYHKYIFLLAESFKALFEEEDQITLATLNLAQAFGGLPVDIPSFHNQQADLDKDLCVCR